MKRVSVVILNWNGRAHLEPCFNALRVQTIQEFDTIVVDNASTDESVPWLRTQNILPIKLVALSKNLGFAGGNAAALDTADGEYVVLLNNDTAPKENWLEGLVAMADSDAEIGAVASLLVDWDERWIDSAGDGVRVTGRGFKRRHGKPLSAAPASGGTFSACGGAVLYRRKMIEDIGFLDTRFFMNGEDTELSFRARLAGWKIWFCREAVVRHRVGASQGVDSPLSVYYNERNHLWCIVKCMPLPLLIKYSWVHLLELPARGLAHLRKGRFAPWLKGVVIGFLTAPARLPERWQLQRRRRVKLRDLDRFFIYPAQLGGSDG